MAGGFTPSDTADLKRAVGLWLSDVSLAISIYGNASTWDTSQVTNMAGLFEYSTFNEDISGWDTSRVTNLYSTFLSAYKFNQDISRWDVSKVTTLNSAFRFASSFNQPIGTWNVGNVESMSFSFLSASSFNQDLSQWDTSKVTSMTDMFKQATAFNTSIRGWDVSSVIHFNGMFMRAAAFDQDVSSWDISTARSARDMFYGACAFSQNISNWEHVNLDVFLWAMISRIKGQGSVCPQREITIPSSLKVMGTFKPADHVELSIAVELFLADRLLADTMYGDIASWDTSLVTDMSSLFEGDFNEDISQWDVSRVTSMSSIFQSASSFNQDISQWDVSRVQNFKDAFSNTQFFDQPIGKWNTASAIYMERMFQNAASFDQDLNTWDVSRAITMKQMFSDATSFDGSIGSWDVSRVTDMYGMFEEAARFAQDLTSWNIAALESAHELFYGACAFNGDVSSWQSRNKDAFLWATISIAEGSGTICPQRNVTFPSDLKIEGTFKPINSVELERAVRFWIVSDSVARHLYGDIGKWDTSLVTDMSGLFEFSKFNEDVSDWDTSRVTSFYGIFSAATFFNQDISKWNVAKVVNFQNAFRSAQAFNQPLSRWDTASATNMAHMFQSAVTFDQDLSSWDVSKVTTMREMFFDASAFNKSIHNWDVSNVIDHAGIFEGADAYRYELTCWDRRINARSNGDAYMWVHITITIANGRQEIICLDTTTTTTTRTTLDINATNVTNTTETTSTTTTSFWTTTTNTTTSTNTTMRSARTTSSHYIGGIATTSSIDLLQTIGTTSMPSATTSAAVSLGTGTMLGASTSTAVSLATGPMLGASTSTAVSLGTGTLPGTLTPTTATASSAVSLATTASLVTQSNVDMTRTSTFGPGSELTSSSDAVTGLSTTSTSTLSTSASVSFLGAMLMSVPDANLFLSDTVAHRAVKEGLAFALNTPGVSDDDLILFMSLARRRLSSSNQSQQHLDIEYHAKGYVEDSVVAALRDISNALSAYELTYHIQTRMAERKGSDFKIVVISTHATAPLTTTTSARAMNLSSTATTNIDKGLSPSGASTEEADDESNPLTLIVVVAVGLVCICTVACGALLITRKRRINRRRSGNDRYRHEPVGQQHQVVGARDTEVASWSYGHEFWFVSSRAILDSRGPLPTHQDLVLRGWLNKTQIGINSCMKGLRAHLAVSHAWSTSENPDPDGVTAAALRTYLRQRPHIEWVWIDFCCLPQVPRTDEEQRVFDNAVNFVSLVYLACSVVKVVSNRSANRFWPQYEAWLSYQSVSSGGALPSRGVRNDVDVINLCQGAEGIEIAMSLEHPMRWSLNTMIDRLKSDDVAVTHQCDKDIQLDRVQDLYAVLAVIHRQQNSSLYDVPLSGVMVGVGQDTEENFTFMNAPIVPTLMSHRATGSRSPEEASNLMGVEDDEDYDSAPIAGRISL